MNQSYLEAKKRGQFMQTRKTKRSLALVLLLGSLEIVP